MNLIDQEIPTMDKTDESADIQEPLISNRSSTPRGSDYTNVMTRPVLEIHDQTSKLIAGTLVQEPRPRTAIDIEEKGAQWKRYTQSVNIGTINSYDDNMAAADNPGQALTELNHTGDTTVNLENSTMEEEKTSDTDIIDNPIVVRILKQN